MRYSVPKPQITSRRHRKVIYTVLFGDRDDLHPVEFRDENCDYICISDQQRHDVGWEVILTAPRFKTKRLEARFYKLNPHLLFPDADMTVFLDGTFSPTVPIATFEALIADADLAAFKHSERKCAYHEARYCAFFNIDNWTNMQAQYDRYKKEKFPENYGLYASGILVRRHKNNTQRFNNLWWSELSKGSVRDQISLMYSLWRSAVPHKPIEGLGSVYSNKLVRTYSHLT